MPEVVRDEQYPVIIREILFGIGILVKGHQPAAFPQFFQNQPGMPPTSECAIDINSFRLNVEAFNHLNRQNRNMVRFIHSKQESFTCNIYRYIPCSLSVFFTITCCAKELKSLGE